MYEPNNAPALRRIILIALIFLATVAVLWLLVWLIFFRHPHTTQNGAKHPSSSSQSQRNTPRPSPSSSDSSKSGSGSQTPKSSNGTKPAPAPTTPSTSGQSGNSSPNRLANTGPGDVWVPAVVAGLAGSGLYYVRLYRKSRA